jgi:nucleoplasmin-like protein
LIHEIERPRKIEQCTLNLTFEEDDEFLLEVVGLKYVLLRRLTAISSFTKRLFSEVHLSGNYIGRAHSPPGSHQVSIKHIV